MAKILKTKNQTAEKYRETAFKWGSPRTEISEVFEDFEPLRMLQEDTTGRFIPVQKLVYFDGRYVQYENGFVVGDEAATERGIDAYSFFDNESQKLIVLIAFHLNASVFGELSALEQNFAHGGSVEASFDEMLAEISKLHFGPRMITSEFSIKLKKPTPIETPLLMICEVCDEKGIKVNTKGVLLPIETFDDLEEYINSDKQTACIAEASAMMIKLTELEKMMGKI